MKDRANVIERSERSDLNNGAYVEENYAISRQTKSEKNIEERFKKKKAQTLRI